MAFRGTLGRAVIVTSLVTPFCAFMVGALAARDLAGALQERAFGLLVFYPFAAIGTALGVLLIALPLTYAFEKGSFYNTKFVGTGLVAFGLIGFVLAALADWPMAEVKQIFWLHWGIASLIFTALYLHRSERTKQIDEMVDA